MTLLSKFFLFVFLSGCLNTAIAQQTSKQLISSSWADTWVAVDGFGREINTSGKSIRPNKYVGIFYFVWQGAHGYDEHGKGSRPDEGVIDKLPTDTTSPYDISQMLAKNPENPSYGPIHAFHYWGEPYFGYYLPNDEWIIRKHAQMLSDAAIDVIIIDVTNAAIYLPQVTKIAETYRVMRNEGKTTPSLTFIVNSAPEKTIQRLYDEIYKKELFKDLWFYWKGKPLLLCPPKALTDETRNFFNVRQSWAWTKDQDWFGDGKEKWPWLDHTPQNYGWHESKDKAEQIPVAIAQHPMSNIGRSFHNGKQPEIAHSAAGLYFNEQWKRAKEVDPEFVFVTGWNEWVAMRFNDGASQTMLGKKIAKGETYFVDLYNAEFSRDAEPVKGDFNDNYYYQLIDEVRQFKGNRALPTYKSTKTIKIDGNFNEWAKVDAVYYDDRGDTFHRKHPGWGKIKEYVNITGRNDIIEARITSDAKNVYLYVKTSQVITSPDTGNWMQLYIGVSGLTTPGWNGFQYMLNRIGPKQNKAILEQHIGDYNWRKVADTDFRVKGNEIEIAIPKKKLMIQGSQFTLDFKWVDNIPADGDPMHWLDKGDAAPNARFKYRYVKQ
jgi:hypothetical protein